MGVYATVYYDDNEYQSKSFGECGSYWLEDGYLLVVSDIVDFTGIINIYNEGLENLYILLYRGKVLKIQENEFEDSLYEAMEELEKNIDNTYINNVVSVIELQKKIIDLELEIFRLRNKGN